MQYTRAQGGCSFYPYPGDRRRRSSSSLLSQKQQFNISQFVVSGNRVNRNLGVGTFSELPEVCLVRGLNFSQTRTALPVLSQTMAALPDSPRLWPLSQTLPDYDCSPRLSQNMSGSSALPYSPKLCLLFHSNSRLGVGMYEWNLKTVLWLEACLKHVLLRFRCDPV
jgi:hypothetical protein